MAVPAALQRGGPSFSIVLQAVAAYVDSERKEKRTVHAVGDGTFIVDGRKIDRKAMMAAKLPSGV